MPRGSRKKSKLQNDQARFGAETNSKQNLAVDLDNLDEHLAKAGVSVSLKYYSKRCECFSKWQEKELKKFSNTIDKLKDYDTNKLKQNKALCDMHKGPPSVKRFKLPDEVSQDLAIYEIKVDPSNKLRIHGFFEGQVFFLIWLDRQHECFRSS